jgi:predicted dehydrogenase
MKLADEADVILQLGKTERFNPAFLAAYPYINMPNYIEINKSVPQGEGLSNHSLVMNNLTELIDIVFFTVKSNLKRVHAAGTPVYSYSNDIVNIRLEFDNSRVANITINRVDGKNALTSTFYQKESIVHVDHATQNAHVSKPGINSKNPLVKEQILIVPNAPIEVELLNFCRNVENQRNSIMFTGDDYKNLFAAHQVLERLNKITVQVE